MLKIRFRFLFATDGDGRLRPVRLENNVTSGKIEPQKTSAPELWQPVFVMGRWVEDHFGGGYFWAERSTQLSRSKTWKLPFGGQK